MLKKIKWPAFLIISLSSALLLFFRHSSFSELKQDDTLLGNDSAKVGFRDDVNDYIQKRFPKSEKRRAALSQLAGDWQSAFQVYDDPIKLKSATIAIDKSQLCANAVFGTDGVDEVLSLMAEIFSNQKRSVAGIRINSLLYEIPLYFPKTDQWIRECKFDPAKMSN